MVSSDYVSYEGYMLVPYFTARSFIKSPRVLVNKDVRGRLGCDCNIARYMLVCVNSSFGWVGLPTVYAMSNFYTQILDASIAFNDKVQRWNEQHITYSEDHSASGAVAYEIWEVLPPYEHKQTNESYAQDLAEYDSIKYITAWFDNFFRHSAATAGADAVLRDSGSGGGSASADAGFVLVYFGSEPVIYPRVSGVRCLRCGDDCGPWVTRYAIRPKDEPYYLCECCDYIEKLGHSAQGW